MSDNWHGELPRETPLQTSRRFYLWTGEAPVPQISHRTAQGTVTIRAATPRISSEVLWNGKFIHYDDIDAVRVVRNITNGNYDSLIGLSVSKLVPAEVEAWNCL